jgi:serine/threonine protein kinase
MQGKTIYGYTLQRPLGVGGMAEVWLAENKIGKKAAVKILLPKLCDDANVTSRFLTEAKVMVELNHHNIRQVYDYGELDGRPTIVMEYLEGEDLREKLNKGQRFSDVDLKQWWNQLVSALNYTHQRGIVHRDIKPGNIFIDAENNVKLLDFGIAKVRESISSTQTGAKLGTLLYMSPEQVKDSKNIDYRTDLYSLAVTFVHLITGKKPYNEDTTSDFEISEQIVYKPLDLTSLPFFWSNLLTPYLNKEADKRPGLQEIPDRTVSGSVQFDNDSDERTVMDGEASEKPSEKKTTNHSPVRETNNNKHVVRQDEISNFKKTKKAKAWIWILVAVVFLLGSGITLNLMVKKKHDAERKAKFTEIYERKTKQCVFFISNIVKDKDGNQANKHFIIQSLMTLKEIEDLENNPNFDKMEITPISQKLFADYKDNLQKAIPIMEGKYQRQVNMGLLDDSYTKDVKNRLDLMNDILKQSEKGNATAIEMIPPKE